jgi:hypothetical protein
MRKTVLTTLLFLLSFLPAMAQAEKPTAPTAHEALVSTVYNAVTLLYVQDDSGGMHMLCTATAYRKIDKGYRFASAAHCVSGETDDEQKEPHYFITADPAGAKTFIPATLLAAGDRNVGDDFSMWSVTTDIKFDVVPLGDSAKINIGAPVVNVASPLGLGKQLFVGYVSAVKLDRPQLDAGEVKWRDVMLVKIGGGPGSSGSAIVSEDQKAIVGFLVGGFQANIGMIIVPASKYVAFEQKVDGKTYKKTVDQKSLFKRLMGDSFQNDDVWLGPR